MIAEERYKANPKVEKMKSRSFRLSGNGKRASSLSQRPVDDSERKVYSMRLSLKKSNIIKSSDDRKGCDIM